MCGVVCGVVVCGVVVWGGVVGVSVVVLWGGEARGRVGVCGGGGVRLLLCGGGMPRKAQTKVPPRTQHTHTTHTHDTHTHTQHPNTTKQVAQGHKLTFGQADIEFKGHAIECRINAEDPFQNFRPGPGRVTTYLAPGGPHVRMDSHLYPDYLVPPNYDSLLGKLIVWADDREAAIVRMLRALDETVITGVPTTIEGGFFLSSSRLVLMSMPPKKLDTLTLGMNSEKRENSWQICFVCLWVVVCCVSGRGVGCERGRRRQGRWRAARNNTPPEPPPAAASRRQRAHTWYASSRVWHSTTACTSGFSSLTVICCRIAITKTAVLPMPDLAWQSTSMPRMACGMHSCCTVGGVCGEGARARGGLRRERTQATHAR